MISKSLIILDMEASNKENLIRQLASRAHEEGKVTDEEVYVESVLSREASYPTYVGNKIAIPHGKTDAVKEAMVLFARLKKEVDWSGEEDEGVDLVFLLGVPETNAQNLHLEILARLSRKLMNEDFVASLRNATTTDEVATILSMI